MLILEVMFMLVLTPSKLMHFLRPPSDLVQGGMQEQLIL